MSNTTAEELIDDIQRLVTQSDDADVTLNAIDSLIEQWRNPTSVCDSCAGFGHYDQSGVPTYEKSCEPCQDCDGIGRITEHRRDFSESPCDHLSE